MCKTGRIGHCSTTPSVQSSETHISCVASVRCILGLKRFHWSPVNHDDVVVVVLRVIVDALCITTGYCSLPTQLRACVTTNKAILQPGGDRSFAICFHLHPALETLEMRPAIAYYSTSVLGERDDSTREILPSRGSRLFWSYHEIKVPKYARNLLVATRLLSNSENQIKILCNKMD